MDTIVTIEMVLLRVYKVGWCVLALIICFSEYGQTSDMLIIRHGRSRVRHSTEKNHLRWGLKALDNLTLDYDYDNETMEMNGNQSSYDITGSDAFYLNGSANSVGVTGGNSVERIFASYSTPSSSDYPFRRTNEIGADISDDTTVGMIALASGATAADLPPAIPAAVKKKIKKKQIMANIRKTVDKGLEYLKSHAHLNEQNMEINSARPVLERNTNSNNNNKNNEGSSSLKSKDNKIQLPFKGITSATTSALALPLLHHPPSGVVTIVQENHVQNDDSLAYLKESNNETSLAFPSLSSTLSPFVYTFDGENQFSEDNAFAQIKSEDKTNTLQPEVEFNKQLRHKEHQHIQRAPNRLQPHAKLLETQHHLNRATNISDDNDIVVLTPARLGRIPDLAAGDEGNDDDADYSGGDTRYSGLYADNNELANGVSDDSTAAVGSQMENFEIIESESVDDYADLELLDDTSRHNRMNLMKGRDVVTQFLQIVETQHLLGANCTAGTDLNLGEGVVDRYAHDRFRVEAEVAVNRANMLTRIFKQSSPDVQISEQLLHASVLSMVEFDDDIFAAGNCFDWNQHPLKPGLFCPFAYRLPWPDQGASYAKDLAAEYHYLGNSSEWFFQARRNAKKVIDKDEQYIKAYHYYTNSTEREVDRILSVKYEDGRWSKPYYDCGGGNIWMLTYTVPFFGYDNGSYHFKGTSGIDIDLRRVDIDQCPQRNIPGTKRPLNIFAGTDKCKQRTTECVPIAGLGFRRGSYKCICRKGFYFPDTSIPQKYFNGSTLEEEYEKLMLNELSSYNNLNTYECLPCAEGCDACKDASPCVAALNWPMRTSILVLACAVIGFLPPAAYFTFRYQQVKVLRAASPALLRVIALGAFFIYCTSIVMYPPPNLYTCTARIWLREIGFSLTYGALMLKTWRISVIFRVRSAKAVKITDAALLKRLGILCGCIGGALLVRTIVAPPLVVVGRTADDLKAYLCKTDWWDHTFTSMEVLFLAWGVRLCIMVRKAPSEFNESRFISMAIYNEFLLTCFLNVSMLFLQSPANPDLLYIIFFCHTQLTVTLLLALIFGSKVYLVFRSGGKPPEDAMGLGAKSSGAKFICRSQARTMANPSTATSSTAQLGANVDSRFTEQEALEQIRQLCVQLQNLQERAPPRGVAVATITTLLESCRSSHPLTLRPPLATTSGALSASNLNGITTTTTTSLIVRSDKSTNTNSTADEMLQPISNGLTRISITDECMKSTDRAHSNGGIVNIAELNNATAASNIESKFSNLHLQCMCTCGGSVYDGMNGVVVGMVAADKNLNQISTEKCACNGFCFATEPNTNSDSQQPEVSNRRKCLCGIGGGERDGQSISHTIATASSPKVEAGGHSKLSECTHCDGSFIKAYSERTVNLETITQQQQQPHLNISQQDTTNVDMHSYGDAVDETAASYAKSNDAYHRIGVSFSESLGNEAPPTPSPTISNISSSAATDERYNECGQLTSVHRQLDAERTQAGGDVDFRETQSAAVACDSGTTTCLNNTSTSSATMSSSADEANSSGGGVVTGVVANSTNKRNKPDAKLVLDLNDRSKYTKEVSV